MALGIAVGAVAGLFFGFVQSLLVGVKVGSWQAGTGFSWGLIIAVPSGLSGIWLGWYSSVVALSLAAGVLLASLIWISLDTSSHRPFRDTEVTTSAPSARLHHGQTASEATASWHRVGDHSRGPLIAIRFGGVYPPGSAGNEFARAMIEFLQSSLAETDAAAVVLDLTALEYEWGDAIGGLAMPLFNEEKGFRPVVIVATGGTAGALKSLLEPALALGAAGMKLVATEEEALAHLERTLDHQE